MLNSCCDRKGGVRRMCFDYNKLKGKIIEKYGSQSKFAKEYGISENSLSAKMNNKMKFTYDDIIKMSEMLSIEKDKIGEYFFVKKV